MKRDQLITALGAMFAALAIGPGMLPTTAERIPVVAANGLWQVGKLWFSGWYDASIAIGLAKMSLAVPEADDTVSRINSYIDYENGMSERDFAQLARFQYRIAYKSLQDFRRSKGYSA